MGSPDAVMFPGTFRLSAYGYLGVQLYPAYWFAVIATTVTVAVVPGGRRHLPWNDVLTNMTMLQQAFWVPHVDAVYRTLFTELRFYLLFVLVAWWGLTYKRVLLFCCVWGAATLVVGLCFCASLAPTIDEFKHLTPFLGRRAAWPVIGYFAPRELVSPWGLVGVLVLGMLVLSYLVNKIVEKPLGDYLKRGLAQL
ncbi:hypothetical protein ABTX77_12245 [Streptomyces sp. NPDC097704]|uniref:hypothetical protein n=1 Tax=Streptomyces sp. NPDC097704 TaxID=3157101 RepID=UPI00332FCDD5